MKKSVYKKYFSGKKVTVMGIGLLGRNLGDIKFMAECGADIIATDLKSEEVLKTSLRKLKKYKNITYTLDRHLVSDFKGREMILKGSGVPLHNKYIDTAMEQGTPIHMSFALMLDILKQEKVNVTVIGVTGTKGKSTTTGIIESVLKASGKTYHLAGNIRGVANLPLLKKIEDGDIILAELDSWQLQGLHTTKTSPDIAVFTNFFQDHLNYYNNSMKDYFYDKSAIFRYQNKNDVLIMTSEAKSTIGDYIKKPLSSRKIVAAFGKEMQQYGYNIFGKHNEKNLALALAVGNELDITEAKIYEGLQSYTAIEGRFQLLGEKEGVTFFNDNNSTTPGSTLASLQAINKHYPDANIILIGGGTDKNFDYEKFSRYISRNISFSIFFSGTATDKIKSYFGPRFDRCVESMSMKTAVNIALEKAESGDVIILSPAAASFGVFKNEYERNDLYMRYVKSFLKK